jgi:hypothetical protein
MLLLLLLDYSKEWMVLLPWPTLHILLHLPNINQV